MNKSQMKRKHMEESNIMLEKRLNQSNEKDVVVKDTSRKDILKDKLMKQLKFGK